MKKKHKRGQEQKYKILAAKPRKAQEEMVGFGLIIVIVAVILLVFLAISIRKSGKEAVESYEVESFISAFLQYNTDCEDRVEGFITVKELVFDCYENEERTCLDGNLSCDILKETLEGISNESWQIDENTPIKGYVLNITINGVEEYAFEKGNITLNSWGAGEEYFKSGNNIEFRVVVYY